jgi:hypothetical protein
MSQVGLALFSKVKRIPIFIALKINKSKNLVKCGAVSKLLKINLPWELYFKKVHT